MQCTDEAVIHFEGIFFQNLYIPMFTNFQIEKYVWKNTEHCMSVRKVNKSSQALPEK